MLCVSGGGEARRGGSAAPVRHDDDLAGGRPEAEALLHHLVRLRLSGAQRGQQLSGRHSQRVRGAEGGRRTAQELTPTTTTLPCRSAKVTCAREGASRDTGRTTTVANGGCIRWAGPGGKPPSHEDTAGSQEREPGQGAVTESVQGANQVAWIAQCRRGTPGRTPHCPSRAEGQRCCRRATGAEWLRPSRRGTWPG